MRRRRLKFSDYYHNIITKELADIYSIKKEEMFLGSRMKNIIFAKRMYIYILRLQRGKFYVGKSNQVKKRISEHFNSY